MLIKTTKKYPVKKLGMYCLLFWIVISSAYFIFELFSGDVSPNRAQNIFHKSFKYFACSVISIYLFAILRNWFCVLWFSFIYFLLVIAYAVNFLIWKELYPGISYALDVLIVFMTMLGFTCVLRTMNLEQLKILPKAIVFSGALVSFFSFVEYFFLASLFANWWKWTGGVRLVSTLLNPNNMGIYIGACILLLFSLEIKKIWKFLILLFFLFPFYMSGSRTAWVSLAFVLFCFIFIKIFINLDKKFVLIYFPIIIIFFIATLFFIDGNIDAFSRFTDFESAFIRIDKYFIYFIDFDTSYLFPDIFSSRVDLVSESYYFTMANFLGFLPLTAVILMTLFLFQIKIVKSVWILLVLYYCIAGLFENIINSFPNNQLFFIALGSVLFLRPLSRKINSHTAVPC